MNAICVATDQQITLIRKKDTITRIAVQTEQLVSVRKTTNKTRVAALNITSEQQRALLRKKEKHVKATNNILHTEQVVSTKRVVTNKRVATLNVASELHLTLHRDARLRERLATLEARVAQLENTLT